MATMQIRVEAVLCPDEQLKREKPDPSWPRYAGLTLNFKQGGNTEDKATTDANGLAASTDLPVATYQVEPDLATVPRAPAGINWAVDPNPLEVKADQAKRQQRIMLIPPAGYRLLPIQLSSEEQGGKATPLSAKVTLEALGEAAWQRTFPPSDNGWIYALIPHTAPGNKRIERVKIKFENVDQDGREFAPVHEEITFRVPEPAHPQVDKPVFDYLPSGPRREQFQGILVKPTIRELSGKETALVGAKVSVQQQAASSRAAEYVRTLEDDQDGEVRFPNLEPGVYTVTVNPPKTFNGWPIKAGPKQAGPHYLSAGEKFEPDVGTFGFEQINLLIKPPDDRSLDHEVPLVIYGPDGSAQVSAKAGKFSAAAPSKFPLRIKLAAGAKPSTGGVPLELETPAQEIEPPPSVTEVKLQYQHAIKGRAVDESRQPLSWAVVVLYDGQQEAGRAVADGDGSFTAGLKKAGSYSIAIQTEGGRPVSQRLVSVQSVLDVGELVMYQRGEPPGRDGQPPGRDGADDEGSGRTTREAFTDLAAYPVLTEQITTAGPPAPAAGGSGGGGGGYGPVVDQAMRDVLGWRPSGDVAGFQAALAGVFQLREVEGHTEWTWQQRGYAVQADMGALTGAQASIYARAKSALDQIMPLLTGLTAINPALYQPQDLEAIRTVVIAELNELVSELALEGGPRIERVDELFRQLLGENRRSANLNPDIIQGQLGTMRDRFGLTVAYVETVDEERIVTNFRIVVEQLLALQASWNATDRALLSVVDANSSLGTVLIWLARGLEAVTESVDDLMFALDSVFVDGAQRQVIELRFPGQPPLLLSDLLDWVVRACRDEGPRMIQDSGKEGVLAFAPVLRKLLNLVRCAWKITMPGAALPGAMRPVPDGLRTPRVSRAFQVLLSQLDEAARLAGLVQRTGIPQITSTNPPSSADKTGQVVVALNGVNFRGPASAVLVALNREDIADVVAWHVKVDNPGQACARFRIPRREFDDPNLTWQVVLINEDGTPTEPAEISIERTS